MKDCILEQICAKLPDYRLIEDDIGVVTATDFNTFSGMQVLFYSLKNKINFICYDLGMTADQYKWCSRHKVTVRNINVSTIIKSIDKWQTYMKPWIIKDSPFIYTIWIDIDCIVVGDLSRTKFALKQTFFTNHWFSQTYLSRNADALYQIFPVANKMLDWINAGVFAINKNTHNYILDKWIFLSERLLKSPNILLNYIVGRDEGTLNWSLQYYNSAELIENDYRYNTYSFFSFEQINTSDIINSHLFLELKKTFFPQIFNTQICSTNSYILHFSTFMNNNHKYWNMLP